MGRLSSFLSLQTLAHLFFVRPVLKFFFGARVEGKENLKGLEQFILVANHNSHLDTPFLFHIVPLPADFPDPSGRSSGLLRKDKGPLPGRRISLPAHLDRAWGIGAGCPGGNAGEASRGPVSHHLPRRYPRGARSQLARFRSGVGRLAVEFQHIPIVPVFLSGVERALPRSSFRPSPNLDPVRVGHPQLFQGSSKDIAATLEGMVKELSEAEGGPRHRRTRRDPQGFPPSRFWGSTDPGRAHFPGTSPADCPATGSVCLLTDDVVFFEGGEPKEVQPLVTEKLREAIGRRAKTARSLKSYKIPKLAELLLRDHVLGLVKRWYTPDLIVADGSPLLNITAWVRLYRTRNPKTKSSPLPWGSSAGRGRRVPGILSTKPSRSWRP